MDKISLKFKFDNPNSADDTAEFLIKFFMETNVPTVENAIKNKLEEQ